MLIFAVTVICLSLVIAVPPTARIGRWDVVAQTCDKEGAGTDASVYLKLFHPKENDAEIILLDNPQRDDFERGTRSHFSFLLSNENVTNIGMFWKSSGSLREAFCLDWVALLNPKMEICYVGLFEDWIGYYSNPPTFPKTFKTTSYSACIDLPFNSAH